MDVWQRVTGERAMDDVACDHCRAQRALVHCAEDAARLCLPCDVAVHAATPGHERAPLCDGCHAAPAVARCDDHGAALCAACSRAAACGAQRHGLRPAGAYTGFPVLAELARILSVDDYIHAIIELPSESLVQDAAANDDEIMAAAAAAALLTDDGDGEHLVQQGSSIAGPKLDFFFAAAAAAYDSINLSNSGAFEESSSSLDYDHPLIMSSWSELVAPSDAHLLQPLTMNNVSYDQKIPMSTNTSNLLSVPRENNSCINMPPDLPAASSSVIEEPLPPEKACENMEDRMKQKGKRQRAKQRYKDKKKKRGFGKQITYASRKATADARKRIKGRFAKTPTSAELIT